MRKIITTIVDPDKQISGLLEHISVQLADGYWENDNWHDEYWNWLDFGNTVKNGLKVLTITVKTKPTWKGVADIFTDKTDDEVVQYVGYILDDCYDAAACVVERYISNMDDEDVVAYISSIIANLTCYESGLEDSSDSPNTLTLTWCTGKPKRYKNKQFLCVCRGSYLVMEFIDGEFYDPQFEESYDMDEIDKWAMLP